MEGNTSESKLKAYIGPIIIITCAGRYLIRYRRVVQVLGGLDFLVANISP